MHFISLLAGICLGVTGTLWTFAYLGYKTGGKDFPIGWVLKMSVPSTLLFIVCCILVS